MCRSYQKSMATAPPSEADIHAKLQVWCRRNSAILNQAGNAALLQHRDYLPHHLLDTHILGVIVKQKPTFGEFAVESATILPHAQLKAIYCGKAGFDGEAEYARVMESNKRMASDASKTLGKIGGTMFIVVRCSDAMVIDPLAITQEIIDIRKKMEYRSDWFDTLAASVVNGRGRIYETEEAFFSVARSSGKSQV